MVARINLGESTEVSEELFSVLSLCVELERKTDGAFSIRLLPVTSLWNFESKTVPSCDDLALALDAINASELSLKDGSAVLSAHEGKYNVIVTITASGNYKEGEGYSVNDCRIAVGEKMSLRFPNYIGEGYCVALSVEE